MRKYIVLLIGFVFTINCFGQEMPKVIPPSPEAANAFKFSEIPVSLYAGLPNIDIPLFEIESGGVTVPISISYHARGIKVAEISSRVGLGWTLNAGGMISRQVRDLPDLRRGYIGQNDGLFTYKDNNGNIDFFTSAAKRSLIWNNYSGNSTWYDFIPDQFYFNSGTGLNGKFIFDYKDGTILAQNFSNIQILSNLSNFEFSGFDMIDEKGNKYIFGNGMMDYDISLDNYIMHGEGNYNRNNPDGQTINPNSWHLSKIITQTGQMIEFTYENEITRYFRRSYDRLDPSYSIPGTQANQMITIPAQYNCYATEIQSEQKRIKEISFDKGKVVFEYHTESREDMNGGNYLKKVLLYNKKGEIIQQKILNYIYTNSSDIDSNNNMNYYLRTMDTRASKRLFLKSVQTKFNDTTVLPPYQFEYDSNKLPSRHSNSVDVWGYYNGNQNGQFFPENQTGSGARAVNVVKSGAGLLNKIINPEGGSTNFYYEHNRVFSNYPKSVVSFDSPNPLIKKTFLLTPLDHAQFDTLRNAIVYSQAENIYRKSFTVPNSVVSKFKAKNMMGDEECGISNNNGCLFIVTIRRLDDNSVVYQLPPTPDNQFRDIVKLEPGNYVMVVQPKNSNHDPTGVMNPDNYFEVTLEWLQENALITDPIYAGGKRINKIEYRDADDSIKLIKTYDYTDPNTGKSSGLLFGLPNFMGIKNSITTIGGQTFTIFQPQGNIPGSPLSTYQGDSLGYGVVTEYLGQGTNTIGKTVNSFTITPESGDFYSFPFHPPTDHEWMRGKQLSTVHYRKNDDGSYTQVKKIENEYLYAGETIQNTPAVFYSLPYRKLFNTNLYCPSQASNEPIELYCTHSVYEKNRKMFRLPLAHFYIDVNDFTSESALFYKVYHITGGTMDLWKTKVTDYLGGNEVVTTTDYGYNYDRHYNLSYSQQTSSDGSVRLNHYLYAQSLELENDAITAALIAKNMVGIPIQKEVRENTAVKLSTEKTIFKDWGNGILAPEIVQTSKGNIAALENRVKYNKYDDKGNLLEVQKENGTKISYIYGYNQTLPVAKIENATYTQVESYVSNIQTLSNGNNEQDLITALNNLRTVLPNAMITTLTYIPLVGVSTITDPKGQLTRYEYDSFNRLMRVSDAEGNPLTETEYHYRNQN